jgi:hypothetical protein
VRFHAGTGSDPADGAVRSAVGARRRLQLHERYGAIQRLRTSNVSAGFATGASRSWIFTLAPLPRPDFKANSLDSTAASAFERPDSWELWHDAAGRKRSGGRAPRPVRQRESLGSNLEFVFDRLGDARASTERFRSGSWPTADTNTVTHRHGHW